jgi:maleylpyruvate isomerase
MSEPSAAGSPAGAPTGAPVSGVRASHERLLAAVSGVRASHERLLAEVAALPPDVARRDSRLHGWTVAHVLTHLARNADGHAGILEGASHSEVVAQYPGGPAQRLADIEAGADRDLEALHADLAAAIARLEAAYDATPPSVWETGTALLGAGARPLAELPFRRWREVEVHRVDLGTGATPASWPGAYVIEELAHQVVRLADRLPPDGSLVLRTTDTGQAWEIAPGRVGPLPGPLGLPHPPGAGRTAEPVSPAPASRVAAVTVEAPAAELVAWLLGRLEIAAAPALASWETR